MKYELRQYSFGETLGKGFNLYFDNFLLLSVVSLLCQIPLTLIMQKIGLIDIQNQVIASNDLFQILSLVLANGFMIVVLDSFLSSLIIHIVAQQFLDKNNKVNGVHLNAFWPQLIPALELSFVIGILTIWGCILLLIPGIIIALGYSLSTAVLMIEKVKIGEAMQRSWFLTKKRKREIFGLSLITGLIIYSCFQLPFWLVANLLKMDQINCNYLQIFLTGLTAPIQSCLMVVIYFNCRIAKEGFNIEHLTQQFSLAEESQQNSEV